MDRSQIEAQKLPPNSHWVVGELKRNEDLWAIWPDTWVGTERHHAVKVSHLIPLRTARFFPAAVVHHDVTSKTAKGKSPRSRPPLPSFSLSLSLPPGHEGLFRPLGPMAHPHIAGLVKGCKTSSQFPEDAAFRAKIGLCRSLSPSLPPSLPLRMHVHIEIRDKNRESDRARKREREREKKNQKNIARPIDRGYRARVRD